MSESHAPQLQRIGTLATLGAELAHLAWEAAHGGVKAHHILNRDTLPEISNWWGVFLLPLLAWFLLGRIARRISTTGSRRLPAQVMVGLIGALLYGLGLTVAFSTGASEIASLMARGILFLALLLPVYRAECVLGLVLGMTFTFGVVLPTAFASILAGISAVVQLVIVPAVLRLVHRIARK